MHYSNQLYFRSIPPKEMQENDFVIQYEGKSDIQGGGHGRIGKCHIIFSCISKPLDQREGYAYKLLQNTPLKSVIPKFYGVHDGNIIISDLTTGFESPCLADLKIGTRHYDLSANQEKMSGLIEKQKGSTTDSHGIRLIDIKIRKNKQVVNQWNKKQGLKISHDELKEIVNLFIPDILNENFLLQLQNILGKIAETRITFPGFRMYASSLLIGYDGDHLEKGIRVNLIDFAHTYLNIEADGGNNDDPSFEDNIILGVRSLINMFSI